MTFVIEINNIYYDDYHLLFPPYKGFSKKEIDFIEFFNKRGGEGRIEILFMKCDHEPQSTALLDPNKYIKRFHKK